MPRLVRDGRLLDPLLIFLLTAVLIGPLFRTKYLDNWASIESSFIADGRFLRANLPHPSWQPLWYCGGRFDYIYPPALRYGTALLSTVLPVEPARAYHLYTALFYCLGIAGVYLLVRIGSGSRGAAWAAAAAAALLSPSVLLIKYLRDDPGYMLPQRMSVLVRYGEGPHMTAFALLGLALAASFPALRGGNRRALALAALFSALVVSNNFYGATALAVYFPLLVWAVWVARGGAGVWLRAAAIAGLAYGLTAWWLVPSYFRVTLDNLKLVAGPGNSWSMGVALGFAAAFGVASWRARRRPDHDYLLFIAGAAAFTALNVLGHHYFKFRVAGEPLRLVPELDLALILVCVEGLRRLWNRSGRWPKAAVAAAGLAALAAAVPYLTHSWTPYRRDFQPRRRIEYRLTRWMSENLPGVRAVATGSVRFWYNAWFDLPQLGGGAEQGLQNPMVMPAQWQLTGGESAGLSVLWAQAMGAGAILVHQEPSQEVYKDFVHPRKFEGVLPVLHDSGEGDRIYGVPRRFPALARVVRQAAVARLKPIADLNDEAGLKSYVAAVEDGPNRPVSWHRGKPASIRLRARIEPGELLLVQETFDPYWRAWSDGRPLRVQRDVMNFMLVEVPPGEKDVVLQFATPLENRIGGGLSLVSLLALAFLAFGRTFAP